MCPWPSVVVWSCVPCAVRVFGDGWCFLVLRRWERAVGVDGVRVSGLLSSSVGCVPGFGLLSDGSVPVASAPVSGGCVSASGFSRVGRVGVGFGARVCGWGARVGVGGGVVFGGGVVLGWWGRVRGRVSGVWCGCVGFGVGWWGLCAGVGGCARIGGVVGFVCSVRVCMGGGGRSLFGWLLSPLFCLLFSCVGGRRGLSPLPSLWGGWRSVGWATSCQTGGAAYVRRLCCLV